MEDEMFFCDLVRSFRKRRKLTQRQLADRIEVSRGTVSLWERGDYMPDTVRMIHTLAEALMLTEEEKRKLTEARYGTPSVLSLPGIPTQSEIRAEYQKRKPPRTAVTQSSILPLSNRQASVERKRGRPRKGGANADVRKGFEVTFDVKTITLLDTVTNNRSEYLEKLVLEHLCIPPTDEDQFALELLMRCKRFPPEVSNKLQEIRVQFGIRAALEASEAVIFLIS